MTPPLTKASKAKAIPLQRTPRRNSLMVELGWVSLVQTHSVWAASAQALRSSRLSNLHPSNVEAEPSFWPDRDGILG
jgi:hypothetical protein